MVRSTNYYDTFIEVAEDCPAMAGEAPPAKTGAPSVAGLQYALIAGEPYVHTSDDVLFDVHAARQRITPAARAAERGRFFSGSQPCLRSSPLAKRYGWGIHSNGDGKVALVPVESPEYRRLAGDPHVRHVKAMRSKRA